ncbi:MAG: glycosyltransferase family 2 protein [Actinomycetia bacterium]|nr:glycosyltransferase family 2 protein [Actinomycetes bacterium]
MGNTGQKTVGIVILTYKNYADTIACLESVLSIDYEAFDLFLVDNASGNGAVESLRAYLDGRALRYAVVPWDRPVDAATVEERIIITEAALNRGYSAGNNIGIRMALARGADYVLVLNNDTSVTNNFLEPLVRLAECQAHIGACGPKIVNNTGEVSRVCARRRPTASDFLFVFGIGGRLFPHNCRIQRYFYMGEYNFDIPRRVDIISGSCMLLKTSYLKNAGLLDENVFLYCEEFILHEGLRNAGLQSFVVPESVIFHSGGHSTRLLHRGLAEEAAKRSEYYYLTRYRGYSRVFARCLIGMQFVPLGIASRVRNTVRAIALTARRGWRTLS